MPENISPIIEYFDDTHVTGIFKQINSTLDNLHLPKLSFIISISNIVFT